MSRFRLANPEKQHYFRHNYADEVGGEPGMIRVFFYLNGFALGDGNLKTSAPAPHLCMHSRR